MATAQLLVSGVSLTCPCDTDNRYCVKPMNVSVGSGSQSSVAMAAAPIRGGSVHNWKAPSASFKNLLHPRLQRYSFELHLGQVQA